jgi:DNA polymerase-4
MYDKDEQPLGRIILHIDFDSFFASVEQQFNPVFRGKPLGVTATNGRTCIIAASREAKRFGVKTAMNVYKAETLCPDLLLTSADFVKYWEVSKKFINICKDFSPFVEVFSIDELFMDITKTAHLFGGAYGLIDKLKKRIELEIGPYITVSVGVSHNKLLAKLGSGLKKPNGIVTITKRNLATVYEHAELTDICGIGNQICKRLCIRYPNSVLPHARHSLQNLDLSREISSGMSDKESTTPK